MQTTKNPKAAIETTSLNPLHWVSNYADYLYSYTITRINDEELARDLIQETFLAALEKIEKFEGRSSERTWLTAILKNKIVDVYRKKSSGHSKETEVQADSSDQDAFFFDDGNVHWKTEHQPKVFGIEEFDSLARKEFNQILRKCMQKLPALWLSVFNMKHMDEEETATICEELSITPSNFWVIIHRSKVNLRYCLQKNWI